MIIALKINNCKGKDLFDFDSYKELNLIK